MYVNNSKNTYEGKKMLVWKAEKPVLFVKFSIFPYSGIQIRIPNTDPDPRQPKESGSTTLILS